MDFSWYMHTIDDMDFITFYSVISCLWLCNVTFVLVDARCDNMWRSVATGGAHDIISNRKKVYRSCDIICNGFSLARLC